MTTGRKILLSLVIVGMASAIAGFATFSAFSSTTSNSANDFAAGTVNLTDNDAGAAMYNVTNQKPGVATTKCIKVTYSGTLASSVKLYASTVAAVGQYVDLVVTPGTGTPTFPGCTGFTPAGGGAIYTGTLKGFADTYNTYANGLSTTDSNGGAWDTNDVNVYQFTLTLQDNNAANGGASGPMAAGSHSFTWEARNN